MRISCRLLRLARRVLMCGSALTATIAVATFLQLRQPPTHLPEVAGGLPAPPVVDRDGRPLSQSYVRDWNQHDQVPLHQVPELLTRAIILAEDKRFFEHGGVDYRARLAAAWDNIRAGRVVRGASTLSEQCVRMLHPRPRTFWTRWLEGWEAQWLERVASKTEILEFYINQVPYAAHRRGVRQASRYYFGRDLSTLNEKEILALAVLIRSPVGMSPHSPKSRVRLSSRIDMLVKRLEAAGDIAKEQLVGQSLASAPVADELRVLHEFPTTVVAIRAEAAQLQETDSGRPIRSTISLEKQVYLSDLLHQQVNRLQEKNVHHGAALLLHNDTGEVLAWVTATADGAEQSRIDAVLVPRNSGSTLKPFVYAAAMEKGWTPSTVLTDQPMDELVGDGVHTYHNYSRRHYGRVSLRDALGNSLNIPAILAIRFVGIGAFIDYGRQLGLAGLDFKPNHYGDGLAIGNAPLSLFELTRAYAVLARQGRAVVPRLTTARTYEESTLGQVVEPQVASLLGQMLSDPRARGREFGTNSVLSLPHQTAVKTGTSSNYRDAWTFAYDDTYTLGVWTGNLDATVTLGVTGSTGSAPVVRSMMDWLNRHREARPLSLAAGLVQRRVCVQDGKLARNGCTARDEWFADWMQPGYQGAVEESAHIITPVDGAIYARDPRVDASSQAIAFSVAESEALESVEWLLNGHSRGISANGAYLWPLQAGHHRLQARLDYTDGSARMAPEVRFFVH